MIFIAPAAYDLARRRRTGSTGQCGQPHSETTHHLKAGGALVSGYPVTDPGAAEGTGVKTDDAESLPTRESDMRSSPIIKIRCHDRNRLLPD
jgi:hypothetical protein